MKKLWLILLFVACLIAGARVQAQNVFKVEREDVSDKENYNFVYDGELVANDQLSITVYGEQDSGEETQFHMMFEGVIVSFILDWNLRLEEYYYAPQDSYRPPFTEQLKISPDIISSGKVVWTNLAKGTITRGEIDKGCVFIEYELYPKKMTVYFYELHVSPVKNKLVKKT